MTWNEEFYRLTVELERLTEAFYKARSLQNEAEKLLHRALLAVKAHCDHKPPEVCMDPLAQEKMEEYFAIWRRIIG